MRENDHSFCRLSLSFAREAAKNAHVKLPKNITTYRCEHRNYGNDQYQIFSSLGDGPFINAHCAAAAKSKFIGRFLPEVDEDE